MLKIVALIAALLAPSLAAAQAPQAIMPPNSVYGRLGAGQSGPGQAIPFATLAAQLFGSGTNQTSTSATLGSWWSDVGAKTPYPDFIVRDRLFVDDGALASSALGAGTSCIPNTRGGTPINAMGDGWPKVSCYSSLYVLSSNGMDAIAGQAVTSLQTGVVGANSNLGVGVLGMGLSNNTVQSETAWGAYFEGQRTANLGWAYGVEIEVGNNQSVQPHFIYGANDKQTSALQLDCGTPVIGGANCSVGLSFISNTSAGPANFSFDRGIVFNLLSVADQGGGVFNAINFPNNYRINWYNNNSGADYLQAYITASDATAGDQVQSLVFGSAAATTTLNSSNFILAGNSTNTTLAISSGAAGNLPLLTFSRTSIDGFLADIAATNQIFTGSVAGDLVIKGVSGLWLAGGAPGSVVPGLKVSSTGSVSVGTQAGLSTILLDVNHSSAVPPLEAGLTSASLRMVGADGEIPTLIFHGFGSNSGGLYRSYNAGGTQASPTAVLNGTSMWNVSALGYDGTQYGGVSGTSDGRIQMLASTTGAAMTSADHGTKMVLSATPKSSIAVAVVLTLQSGVQIGAPTGGDEGAGTLNFATGIYANGSVGVSCAVNTPAHLTVVLGIVTVCN